MAFHLAVLVSGFGSNLQALIEASQANPSLFGIQAVISNRSDAYALERAHAKHIPTYVVSATAGQSREDYDQQLSKQLETLNPDLIVMAGFMRILSPSFTEQWQQKLINIHPSLLPKYAGLNTHQRAIDAGDNRHGVSVHYVSAEVDGGPIIAQADLPIEANDTADTLAQRIHQLEHQLLPKVVMAIAKGDIYYNPTSGEIHHLGHRINQPLTLAELAGGITTELA
jgi:phosphoribosylglycinamide formyltransferase-1